MQNSKRFALLLLASAAAMAGFDGGCGQIEPQPIPPPQPSPSPTPPPPAACVDLLDEAACTAQASCRAIFVEVACTCPACPPGALECPPCDCPPPSSTFVGCEERSGCESLGEAACNADPTCESIYAQPACLSAPEDAAPCAEPGCGRCTEPATFAGCQDRVVCPAVLCAPCEFGVAVDQNGCATCECLPPPNECAGLDEATCIQIPGCDPVYGSEPGTGTGGGSGGGAAPPACDCAGAPDCGCEDRIMPPPPPAYSGCVPTAVRCEELSEQTCQMTPGCHPEYAYPPCAAFCPPDDPNCGGSGAPNPPACDPVFTYCAPDQVVTGCTSDFDCLNGYCEYGAQPGTGTRPAGDAAQPEDPGVPVPPPSGVCVAVSCGDQGPVLCDAIPPVCGRGQVAGALGGCWSCFDARTCQPVNGPSQCVSDFDCFGGYCEQGPVSGGGSSGGGAEPPSDAFPVPPPGGYCVYPVCGDGSEIACDAIPPTCGVGQVAGAANGCWACYDARSCQPVNGPQGCFDDSQCPNGYCDGGINGGGATPPGSGGSDPSRPALPPEGMCVFPSCDDGSPLMCRMHTPVCAPGTVVSIINGCYECRDARTCQPPVSSCDGSTTDCG
jgi:hypothetical protein